MSKTIYQIYLEMVVKIIKENPNDQELGEKIRKLYHDILKNTDE